jgi:hypothetical protein
MKSIMVKSKTFKRDYQERNQWISMKELPRFLNMIIWCTGTEDYRKNLYKILNQSIFIWERSGSTFLFKYLKEVMRLTVRRLSGMDLEPSKEIFVKLNKYNFPAIIGAELSECLLNKEKP